MPCDAKRAGIPPEPSWRWPRATMGSLSARSSTKPEAFTNRSLICEIGRGRANSKPPSRACLLWLDTELSEGEVFGLQEGLV